MKVQRHSEIGDQLGQGRNQLGHTLEDFIFWRRINMERRCERSAAESDELAEALLR
jgi:hypothetical protein